MIQRAGKNTILFDDNITISASAAIVGKEEGKGPYGKEFDEIYDDDTFGEDSWEKAESKLQSLTIQKAIEKAGRKKDEIDMIIAGDLLNQCTGSAFGIRDTDIPFLGMFGACSTMALSLATASVFVGSGAASVAVAATSSHFCSAEKQFRFPLEYGGQRPPTAQRTCTASGAAVVEKKKNSFKIDGVIFGRIKDLGVTDSNNMGAAMAPAAADTVYNFLKDTNSNVDDFDMILTGDLGNVGSDLFCELMKKDHGMDACDVHEDCGKMMFFKNQDSHSGGSGCGCSGSIFCSNIVRRLSCGELKKVLFVATGALMSPVSTMQGESIPGIAHGVLLSSC